MSDSEDSAAFTPPLPDRVLSLIARARVCYLATVEEGGPHLCLMRMTWVPDAGDAAGGLLVLTTRRATRKFGALVAVPRVAVLMHDFAHAHAGAAAGAAFGEAPDAAGADGAASHGTLSVTLYGDASVLEGAEAERLRAVHLAANVAYRQFIAGDDIAVVGVRACLVRVCDVQDRVEDWTPRMAAATTAGRGTAAAANVHVSARGDG